MIDEVRAQRFKASVDDTCAWLAKHAPREDGAVPLDKQPYQSCQRTTPIMHVIDLGSPGYAWRLCSHCWLYGNANRSAR